MISDRDRCYLLEVNHSPSFSVGTPIDELIKSNLVKDTFELINLTPEMKEKKMNIEALYRKDKISRFKSRGKVEEEKRRKLKECLQYQ